MWLINTSTLKLEEFQECRAETYAILSHTWGTNSEELSFDEFRKGDGREKAGFEKIRLCCEQAQKENLQYAWVDTCCINKQSSTELSEAINSMFSWYQQSKICYVYLQDVSNSDPLDPLTLDDDPEGFRGSRWFTRGWTLQELLAPKRLTFFTKEWTEIGHKAFLAEKLNSITGIHVDVLTFRKDFLDCSIAQRMSWASRRQTTRMEDKAYCLIGIFNVNMPLMYGEGSKAFLRLQQQIIEHSDDETIFAWTGVPDEGSGLLAPSSDHFVDSATVDRGSGYAERPNYTNTNKGLSIECRMLPCEMNTYVVPLQCCLTPTDPKTSQIVLFIGRTMKDDQYRRVLYQERSIDVVSNWELMTAQTRKIFIPTDGRGLEIAPRKGLPLVHIRSHFETWRFEPIGDKIKDSLLNVGTDTNCSNDPEGGATHVEISLTAKGHLRRSVVGTTSSIQLERKHLENGAMIAVKHRSHPDADFSSIVQFGFDLDFKPVCVLHMWSFRFHSRYPIINRWQKFHVPPELKLMGSFWTDWTPKNTNLLTPNGNKQYRIYKNSSAEHFRMSRGLKSYRVSKNTGGRFDQVILEPLRVLFALNSCTCTGVCFRHLHGLEWELVFQEERRHRRGTFEDVVCADCCLSFLLVIAMSLGFICGAAMLISAVGLAMWSLIDSIFASDSHNAKSCSLLGAMILWTILSYAIIKYIRLGGTLWTMKFSGRKKEGQGVKLDTRTQSFYGGALMPTLE